MNSARAWRVALPVLLAASGCGARQGAVSSTVPAAPPLVAGFDERVVEGSGSVACPALDETAKQLAAQAAVRDAVQRAKAAYGPACETLAVTDLVSAQRVERYWQGQGQCFATAQATIRTSLLETCAKGKTREDLGRLGRPAVAFVVVSYRILPNLGATTRRAAAEVIDSLQQELITKGFDVHRSLRARTRGLDQGGAEVADISSAERVEIAAAARKDGLRFLVQGEIKVSDEGKQADGEYLAVVDGSLEAVELRADNETEPVIASFRDVATAKHVSASAAYTTAISGFARSAAATIAPQMLDTWQHSPSRSP